ncbi:MAG: methyltransferase family protein [Chitinophagales bacterium]
MQRVNYKDIIFVVLQLLLFALFFFSFRLSIAVAAKPLIFLGYLIAITGVLIIAIAVLQLKKNLTIFPTPVANGGLVTSGVYAIVRHPLYTGILSICFGVSIVRQDFLQCLFSVCILILFVIKSDYEEKLLEEKFTAYKNYKTSTGKLFPNFFNRNVKTL